jgi:membrane protein DedA with SNARE-associated domain
VDLVAVIVVAFAGAVAGDLAGYMIGRAAGRTIVRKLGRFFFLPESRLPVLESYFKNYGMRAILLGRLAPFLRSVRTLVAGIAHMPLSRFLPPDLIGAAAWASAIALIGFVLGESWEVANRTLGAFGFVVFVLLAIGFFITWRRVRARVERELAGETHPRAKRASPPAGRAR